MQTVPLFLNLVLLFLKQLLFPIQASLPLDLYLCPVLLLILSDFLHDLNLDFQIFNLLLALLELVLLYIVSEDLLDVMRPLLVEQLSNLVRSLQVLL